MSGQTCYIGDREVSVCHTPNEKFETYVSSPKNAMKKTTTALYIEPTPYAHLQLSDIMHEPMYNSASGAAYLVRAHRKPNRKGETKGEIRKPIVHILSYGKSMNREVAAREDNDAYLTSL